MVPAPPKLILLLMTDQFRYDALQPGITPHLWNELREDPSHSTTFQNAYTSTPICTPARASLLTGKSPWNHGMLGYGYTVNCTSYKTVLPAILHDLANYSTFSVGKNHFGWHSDNEYVTHGYQHLQVYDALTHQPVADDYMKYYHDRHPNVSDPLDNTCKNRTTHDYNEYRGCAYGGGSEQEHPTEWTTRKAIEYLEQHFEFGESDGGEDNSNNNNPHPKMFLKVSYHRPHSPYDPPQRILDERMAGDVPSRIINNTSWDAFYKNTTEMPASAWFGDPGEVEARKSRAAYLGSCQFVDEGVGKLFAWLKKNGIWNSTLIIWISDHGDMNGDHNLWRKGYAYEGSAHVNLIVKLPAAADDARDAETKDTTSIGRRKTRTLPTQPATSDAIVETRDVAVTLYDYLGILDDVLRIDPMMDGKSLLPILTKEQPYIRDWLDLELSTTYRADNHWNAIVGRQECIHFTGNNINECELWKYIFHVQFGTEQLFCLTNDRNEHYDLANETAYAPVLQFWRQTLVDLFERQERGSQWFKDGKLVTGRPAVTFAANYPCTYYDPIESSVSALQ